MVDASEESDPKMGEEGELKMFPVSSVQPLSASFGGSLAFNPYSDLPPTIWYGIGIDLAEIDLGDDAPAPDLWGTKINTSLSLGGIVLPQRHWRDISGVFGPVADVGESSVYISDVHNPIDILRVQFQRLQGVRFLIELDLLIAFEFEDAGFADTKCSVEVEAEYEGLSFYEPIWNNPESLRFPDEWNIPSEYNESTVLGLFERFVDAGAYSLKRDGRSYALRPLLQD